MPRIDYRQTGAWAGIPSTSAPTLPDGSTSYVFSAAALPVGPSLNAATGVVSGTPTEISNSTSYPIQVTATFTVNVTVTLNGVSFVVPALGSMSFQ